MIYFLEQWSDRVYFVHKGNVLLTWDLQGDSPAAVYNEGSLFGELEVQSNTIRQFSCFALSETRVLVLKKEDFRRIFMAVNSTLKTNTINYMNTKISKLQTIVDLISQFDSGNLFNLLSFLSKRYSRQNSDFKSQKDIEIPFSIH